MIDDLIRKPLIILALVWSILACAISPAKGQSNLDLESWTTNGFGGNEPNEWGTLNGFMALGWPQSTWKDTTGPGEGLASAKLESFYISGAPLEKHPLQ